MDLWFVKKINNLIRRFFFTTYLRDKVRICGKGLVVNGPIRLINEGKISIGNNVIFDSASDARVKIKVGKKGCLIIGSNVYFNEGVRIICNSTVEIRDFTLIASDVLIIDDDYHTLDPASRKVNRDSPNTKAPIIIEENVWLCSKVIILKGVVIGKNSVVAAGSVVSRSIPAGFLAAGVPAKPVRKL